MTAPLSAERESFEEFQRRNHCGQVNYDELERSLYDLRAENETLRAENLELGAELTSMLNDEIADGFDRNDIEKLQARAEKAEAQLAKVAPLIQAVMGAKHLPGIINNLEFLVTKFTKFYPGAPEELAILRAALALREGEK